MLRISAILVLTLSFAPLSIHLASTANQEVLVYTCPMHPEVQSSIPDKCPKCELKLVVQAPVKKEPERWIEAYTCPMHPEIRTGAAGKCPKCEMALIPANPAITEEYELRLECSPRAPRPNEKTRLRFVILNPRTGAQVKQFAIMHEKLFHLFIISQDLNHFQHIHPELEPDGSFTIDTVLPQPGHYRIYSDFYPVDGTPQMLPSNLTTAGYRSNLFASQARITPDTTLVKVVDGMRIELKLEPAEIIAGKPATLKYHLTDAKAGEPVRDLVPYLGAWGHTLIISEDQSDYIHSHPSEAVPESGDRAKLNGGPDVTFEALFPRPGNYRIWTQFQRGDVLSTVSFTVRAVRLR